MWFGTDKGVARYDGATVVAFDSDDGLPEDFVTAIAQGADGAIYVKTFEKGWARFDGAAFRPVRDGELPPLEQAPQNKSYPFEYACDQTISYLVKHNFETRHVEKIACKDGAEPFVANKAFIDREGALWIGTFGQGVKTLRSNIVTLYSKESGLPSNQVNVVFKDSRGRIWLGTSEGIAVIENDQLRAIPCDVTNNEMRNIMGFAEQGDTIVVASLHYLFRLDADLSNQRSLFKRPSRRVQSGVSAIVSSNKGFSDKREPALWVATYGAGLHCVCPDSQRAFRVADGLASDMMETIDEGIDALWFSSRNAGVTKFSNGAFQTFTTADGLPSNAAFSVFEELDENGEPTAWICTNRGLAKWNRREKKTFTTREGLSSDGTRFAFRQKRTGALWVVVQNGLCEMRGERFVFRGSIPIRPKKESAIMNFLYDDAQETLWIATSDGALKLELKHFAPLAEKPTPWISRIEIDTMRFLTPTSLGELDYKQNTIAFAFGSNSYREPQNAKFRFRLKGSDKEWTIASERRVTYRNLPDGDYEMEVFAINADGIESETPARLAFAIAPPFWKSKWAYLLYAMALAGALRLARWLAQNWNVIVENRKRRHIGNYEIKELLGEGGMGKVYKATDQRTRRVVAIKALHAALMNDAENRRRLTNEGQLLREFSHPNIVKVYEVGETDREGYIVMELLSGGTLKEYLAKHHPLPLEKILRFALQICDGLAEIHKRGIVHRDLKTTNLMLDERETIRIMDFGLSKSPLVSMKTTLGTIIGTLGYVAPEQIMGRAIDARTDIFSFGVTLYELCANQLPFAGENEMAVIHAIFNRTPTPLSSLRPDLPNALSDIVAKCLQIDAQARYQTIEQVRDDLQRLVPTSDVSLV